MSFANQASTGSMVPRSNQQPSIEAPGHTYPHSPYSTDSAYVQAYPNSDMVDKPRPHWPVQHCVAPVISSSPVYERPANSAYNQTPGLVFVSALYEPQKRPRRSYGEIQRMYECGWNGCDKAYGTLNHLNSHVTIKKHGQKRTPQESKEILKKWKALNSDAKRETERVPAQAAAVSTDGGPEQGHHGVPAPNYGGSTQLLHIGYPAPASASGQQPLSGYAPRREYRM